MRTFFTALAFVVIFMAVLPAVRRSMLPREIRQARKARKDSRDKV